MCKKDAVVELKNQLTINMKIFKKNFTRINREISKVKSSFCFQGFASA